MEVEPDCPLFKFPICVLSLFLVLLYLLVEIILLFLLIGAHYFFLFKYVLFLATAIHNFEFFPLNFTKNRLSLVLILQYGNYQRRIIVEDLNKKWKRVILNTSVRYSFPFLPFPCMIELLAYGS